MDPSTVLPPASPRPGGEPVPEQRPETTGAWTLFLAQSGRETARRWRWRPDRRRLERQGDRNRRRRQRLDEALSLRAGADLAERRLLAISLAELADDVSRRQIRNGHHRTLLLNLNRAGTGLTAAAAAASGGALAGGLQGTAAALLATGALAAAAVGGLATAMAPETDTARYRGKTNEFGQLEGRIWDYLLQRLPTAPLPEAIDQLDAFRTQEATLGIYAERRSHPES